MEPEIYNWTSRSLAMSRKAIAMKSLKEKWLSMVQSAREKGENGIGGSSIVTLPPSLLRDSDSNIPLFSQLGGGCMSCGCGWETGAHMTKLPTYGTGAHVTGTLGMSKSGQSTEGTDVFGTLGVDVVGRPTLEASYHGGCGRGGVGDVNWVSAGASSHNHLQSSGESNMSRAHHWSSSSVNPRPTSLSWSSIPSVAFPRREGVRLARGKWVCLVGQLGKWVDHGVGGGHRVGGQGGSGWAGGMRLNEGKRGSTVFFFLNCSLHCIIGVVVGLLLSL